MPSSFLGYVTVWGLHCEWPSGVSLVEDGSPGFQFGPFVWFMFMFTLAYASCWFNLHYYYSRCFICHLVHVLFFILFTLDRLCMFHVGLICHFRGASFSTRSGFACRESPGFRTRDQMRFRNEADPRLFWGSDSVGEICLCGFRVCCKTL